MGDVCDEFMAVSLGCFQRGGHVVEAQRKLPDFIAAVFHLDAGGKIAVSEAFRGCRHAFERPRHARCDIIGKHQRNHQNNERDKEEILDNAADRCV